MNSASHLRRVPRRLLSVVGLGFVCALTACYSDGSANERRGGADAGATAGPAEVYPAGIVTTTDAKRDIKGVYPAASDGAQSCCWLGPEARFRVATNPNPQTLKLTVYEPAMGNLAVSQRVSVLDAAGREASSHAVTAGTQTFTLRIPKDFIDNRSVLVTLRMASSIVPKDIGVNSDPRRLSIILQDISAQ